LPVVEVLLRQHPFPIWLLQVAAAVDRRLQERPVAVAAAQGATEHPR
jgi:hypothetical protein